MYIQKSGNNTLIFFEIRAITHYSFKYSHLFCIYKQIAIYQRSSVYTKSYFLASFNLID